MNAPSAQCAPSACGACGYLFYASAARQKLNVPLGKWGLPTASDTISWGRGGCGQLNTPHLGLPCMGH